MGAQPKKNTDKNDNNNIVEFDDLWVSNKESYSSTPGVYVRQGQENEIDLLWGGVKDNKINNISPFIFLFIGFIAGILLTVAISTILFWGTTPSQEESINLDNANKNVVETTQQSVKAPAEKPLPVTYGPKVTAPADEFKDLQNYEIASGDSLGKIAIKFYGSSHPKYIKLIQETNNLATPHSITAGKKLLIPVKN